MKVILNRRRISAYDSYSLLLDDNEFMVNKMFEKIKRQADDILYKYNLFDELSKYNKVYFIGSYRMDLMIWNDLDLYVDNVDVKMSDIYKIIDFIIIKFKPIWFEAKEGRENNKKYYFIGFETNIFDKLWNIDIRFICKSDINESITYCENISTIAKNDTNIKNAINNIKLQLIDDDNYSYDKYTSIDVYNAVINKGIRNINEFYSMYNEKMK